MFYEKAMIKNNDGIIINNKLSLFAHNYGYEVILFMASKVIINGCIAKYKCIVYHKVNSQFRH